MTIPNPALAPFSEFIGEWETAGSHPYMPGVALRGRTSFSWLEGGAFVMMRSEIEQAGIPSGLAVIGGLGRGAVPTSRSALR